MKEVLAWIFEILCVLFTVLLESFLKIEEDEDEWWSVWWSAVIGIFVGLLSVRAFAYPVFPSIPINGFDAGLLLIPIAVGFFFAIVSNEPFLDNDYDVRLSRPIANFFRGAVFSLMISLVRLALLAG